MRKLGAVATALLLMGGVAAEQREHEMTTYMFVLLHRGPNRAPMGEREIQRLQEEHLAYMGQLHGDGKLVLEGPVDSGGDLLGVVVLDAATVEQAQALMAADPWVRVGKRSTEIHPWWTAKDVLLRPPDLRHNARCWLGLALRPAGAPDYPAEKLREIQASHMENIGRMAESGDLVLAGPMGDDGVLRGIFVFRTSDPSRIVELFKHDAAYRAGRLEMKLYPWHVPRGSLPD